MYLLTIMKAFLLALVVAFGVFAGYPLLAERTDSHCTALALRYRTMAARQPQAPTSVARGLPSIVQADSSSSWAAEYLARRYLAAMPAPVTCNIAYWESIVHPSPIAPAVRSAQR